MFRRSLPILAQQGRRTVVRDPRKAKVRAPLATLQKEEPQTPAVQPQQPPLPLQPLQGDQQPTLATYALAGVGVTLGVIFVRVFLGV